MAEEGLLVQSKHLFEINIEPGADPGNFARLAAGFNSFEVALNEELDQTPYLDGDGYATSTVMGAQLTITFTGHRKFGDPAQDFIFSKAMGIGNGRETEFRWTLPSGEVLEGPCTLAEVTGPSGEANAKGEITVAIHFNGKPEYTPANGGGGVEG